MTVPFAASPAAATGAAAAPGPACTPFADVTPGAFYADAVGWMYATGLTTGTSPTTYQPDRSVTRGELATFLWRLQGSPTAACAAGDGSLAELVSAMDALVAAHAPTHPWLARAWSHIRTEGTVVVGGPSNAGSVQSICRWGSQQLPDCTATHMTIGRDVINAAEVLIHELGHVYDRTTALSGSSPWGVAQLYVNTNYPSSSTGCQPAEITAETMLDVTLPGSSLYYFASGACSLAGAGPSAETEAVVADALSGSIPGWFDTTYRDGAQLWADIIAADDTLNLVSSLSGQFGGYCSTAHTMAVLADPLLDDNPFRDGGC